MEITASSKLLTNSPEGRKVISYQKTDFDRVRWSRLMDILKDTVADQARFAVLRLEKALPKMLAAAPSGKRDRKEAKWWIGWRNRIAGYAK